MNIKPISQLVAEFAEEKRLSLEAESKRTVTRIKRMERNRSLLADLDAIGISVFTYYNDNLEDMEVPLGSTGTLSGKKAQAAEKAAFMTTLKKVRELVGGPLLKYEQRISNEKKKLIEVVLTNDSFPGVNFTYICKLSKNAKCKIVRTTYRNSHASLVCRL